MHVKDAVKGILSAWLLVSPGSVAFAGVECSWKQLGEELRDVRIVAVDRKDPARIWVGTGNRIFFSQDRGNTWRMVRGIPQGTARGIVQDPFRPSLWYAVSGSGLYRTSDAGNSWQRIFKVRGYPEEECLALAVGPGNAAFCAATSGISRSVDGGRRWEKEQGVNKAYALAFDSVRNVVFAAARDGVYSRVMAARLWEKSLSVVPDEEGELPPDIVADESRGMAYAVLPAGVYRNRAGSREWERMPEYGLLSGQVAHVCLDSHGTVYAAAGTGVYGFKGERWYEVSQGLTGGKVLGIAVDSQGNIYAACENGLFTREVWIPEEDTDTGKGQEDGNEPDINQVFQAAIRYADVDPEKIREWHRQAQKKAYLPQVNVGFSRDTTDLWHWEGGSTTKTGDDCLMRGRDSLDWSVSLTWDLGEVVWNNDHTGIDNRSKLMAEMRADILDEVAKIYFERKRAKQELSRLRFDEGKKKQEMELRVRELTALLDAHTGGFFTGGNR